MSLLRALWSLGLLALITPGRVDAQQADDDWSLSRQRPRSAAPARARARMLRAETPESKSARLYRAALANPDSDYALEQLRASEFEQHGSWSASLERLQAELGQHADDRARRELLARVLVDAGQIEQGLSLLDQAPDEHSASLRARLLTGLGRHEQAARQWLALSGNAQARRSKRATWLREAAREQLAAGQPGRALESAQQAQALGGPSFAVELRALEHAAARESGRLGELAEKRAQRGDFREAAALRQELGDEEGALTAYRARLGQSPTDLLARAELSQLLAKTGQLDAAKRELLELMRRAPTDPQYLISWAELSRAEGARSAALARLASAARQRPRDAALHRALRALYLRWDEPTLAERELSLLAALEPSEPEHRLALADRALARGERTVALGLLNRLTAQPESAAAQADLARLLSERDLLPEAIEHAQRAVAGAPQALDYRRLLASLLERGARPLDAEHAWREVAARADTQASMRAEAREHLISLWRRGGTARIHAAELEAKLRDDRFDPELARTLLVLYAREPEQRVRQQALIERLLAHVPDDLVALAMLEQAQLERRELSAALATRERSLALAASVPASAVQASEAALELARTYALEAAAPSLVARALTVASRDGKLWRLAGEIYSRRHDYPRARSAYERARELDPRDFAALYALAEDALRRQEQAHALALLAAIVEAADDDTLLVSAAGLLLLQDGGEPVLLRSLARGTGSVRLRILLQHFARTVLPAALAALVGEASPSELSRVTSTVQHALGTLLQALSSNASFEREVALRLLAAAALPATVMPLLALAERSELPASERALALTGLGRARAARAAGRLQALLEPAGRQLRPFVLYALARSAPAAADSALAAALRDRDLGVRGMAILLAAERADPISSEALSALLSDRAPAIHATALWLLARREPSHHASALDALAATLEPGSPLLGVVLSASEPSSALLAASLFADETTRALSARILTHEPVETLTLPAPSWPFDFARYLERVATLASAGPVAARYVRGWSAIERAALERLTQSGDASAQVLASLVAAPGGGLVPSGLPEVGTCVPSALTTSLSRALQPALARRMLDGAHPRALELLLASGGAQRPEVLALLERGSSTMQRELAQSLALRVEVPTALRPGLAQLLQRSPDWPTRMWAARALKVSADQLAHEPFALVRSAAAWSPSPPARSALCSALNRVTN